jgi:hypothetical protein
MSPIEREFILKHKQAVSMHEDAASVLNSGALSPMAREMLESMLSSLEEE